MSPRPRSLSPDANGAPPAALTPLEQVQTLAESSESDPLRALATEVLALRALLADPTQAPDLEGMIDRAVAMVLARGNQKDDKGQYFVSAREIDAAVKWYAVKMKHEDPEELGGALGRGGQE